MARAGIYKSEVVRARERLLVMGRYPSIDAVRAELGDTGSKATIHRYMKEIEEETGGATGTKVAVSEAIQELVGRLAGQLHEEADERLRQAETQHLAKVKQQSEALAGLKSEADATRVQLQQTELALAAEQQRHTQTTSELRNAVLEQTKVTQEVTDLREQLNAQEQHRQSLEEKHQHARESLEHFRHSAKEQREQENRKHDQALQYLQSEVRTVNQALTAKQHEVTQAHQENVRMLADLGHARAALQAAQDEERLLKQQNSQLAEAHRQSEKAGQQLILQLAEAKKLETVTVQLQTQVDELIAEAQQRQLELATTQSAMRAQRDLVDSILGRLGDVATVNANDGMAMSRSAGK